MTETNKQNLRVADNAVTLAGVLIEKDVSSHNFDDGRIGLSVDLTIETGENNQHRVRFFSLDKYKDRETGEWKEISSYAGLRTVADTYQPASEVGKEEADLVEIIKNDNPRYPNATISKNEYHGAQGLASFPQIEGSRISRIRDKSNYQPHAKFDVEVVVDGAPIEEVVNEEETGRAILKTYIVINDKGNARIAPFDFIVDGDGAGYVLDNYENGDTVSVWGDIVNTRVPKEVTKEGAFGGDKTETTYQTTRELIITGGTEPYDEENPNSYSAETIRKALVEREGFLDGLEKDFNKKNGGRSGGGARTGFDTAPTEKRSVEGDDLPF